METYCEVFERVEKKYRLDAWQYAVMLSVLAGRMKPDAFGATIVMSLYLDTSDYRLIERSLEKPLYKEKLRLRSYGMPQDESRVFLEIKKKYKGIVYKRRVGMSLLAAQAYLNGMPYQEACRRYPLVDPVAADESVQPRSLQIAREFDACRARYGMLYPSILVVCDRTAYIPLDESAGGLRITFDTNLAFWDQRVAHSDYRPLLLPSEAIMEIKNAGPMPLWLAQALAANEVYPTSFSKYGQAYRIGKNVVAQSPFLNDREISPVKTALAAPVALSDRAVPSASTCETSAVGRAVSASLFISEILPSASHKFVSQGFPEKPSVLHESSDHVNEERMFVHA